ncbi:MAG: superoxide dismutase [Deltaproteobacteria bacterium]|nr:MAG: superoxide dismutase [Deltaproteobacteria bacterium]
MKRFCLTMLCASFLWIAISVQNANAHCQIPCGIYDDHARIHGMYEDILTVRKAVRLIKALSNKKDAQSRNQAVRWIVNKEKHAEAIIRTISDYFLTQKIKAPKAKDAKATQAYYIKLARHHAVMKAAMKVKQTVSGKAVDALKAAVDGIANYWPHKDKTKGKHHHHHKHNHKHHKH